MTVIYVVSGKYVRLKPKSAAELIDYLLDLDAGVLAETEIVAFRRNDIVQRCTGADILNTWAAKKAKDDPTDGEQ